MKIIRRVAIAAAPALALIAFSGAAAHNPVVGGTPMLASRTIVQNAMSSSDHTTLVAAVKAAGLVQTLSSRGPFTVFAPTNAAFGKLPAGSVETLVLPVNKAKLTELLTYHVVPGRLTAGAIGRKIRAGGGTAMLTTVQGEALRAHMEGKWLVLTDGRGNQSRVTTGNVMQSNGVVHVVDGVLMP